MYIMKKSGIPVIPLVKRCQGAQWFNSPIQWGEPMKRTDEFAVERRPLLEPDPDKGAVRVGQDHTLALINGNLQVVRKSNIVEVKA